MGVSGSMGGSTTSKPASGPFSMIGIKGDAR